jgi:hypothetical protein
MPKKVLAIQSNLLFNRLIIINFNSWFQTFDMFCMLYVFFWAYKIQMLGNYPEENIQHFNSWLLLWLVNSQVANNRNSTTYKHKQQRKTNTNRKQIIHWDTLWCKTENNISQCHNLCSEETKSTTNWICHSGSPHEGTVFRRQTNTKQRKDSEVPGENSIMFTADRQHRIPTPHKKKNYNKNCVKLSLLLCRACNLSHWRIA